MILFSSLGSLLPGCLASLRRHARKLRCERDFLQAIRHLCRERRIVDLRRKIPVAQNCGWPAAVL
jgi:hypothetical protein